MATGFLEFRYKSSLFMLILVTTNDAQVTSFLVGIGDLTHLTFSGVHLRAPYRLNGYFLVFIKEQSIHNHLSFRTKAHYACDRPVIQPKLLIYFPMHYFNFIWNDSKLEICTF